jgi:2-phospho-L-lactate guanylyltransferase (CobY/MobA/RfbA family)
MVTIVIPFRAEAAKSRLPEAIRARLAEAMLDDVRRACEPHGDVVVAGGAGGQGEAVAEMLARVEGPVAIVNADLPCATADDIAALIAQAPALAAAHDGTTNALSLENARDFRPLYGPGSAARFGLRQVELENLVDDVDTIADLERVAERVGPATRSVLALLKVPA